MEFIFFFFPINFINITEANANNVAWLRNIGSSITGLLFFGLLFIFINPKKSLKLLNVIVITSFIQTLALIYSRLFDEFSAKNFFLIDITIYSAIFVTIYLVYLAIMQKRFFD